MHAISSCIVVLLVLTATGCHPRLPGSDVQMTSPGTGGSGGLDTVRLKVIAAIAAGDYGHARELLELAAGLEEVERERLEQMISAAERGLAPFLEGALPHIFRDKAGHFPQDTAQARELIQTTVDEANFLGLQDVGNWVYQRILETGEQIWVYVRNGKIINAGLNAVPESAQRLLRQGGDR
jgi:hypothetical protein